MKKKERYSFVGHTPLPVVRIKSCMSEGRKQEAIHHDASSIMHIYISDMKETKVHLIRIKKKKEQLINQD